MTSKTVYLYDDKTGEYGEAYTAQPSPLFDPENHPAHESHIVPTHSTEIAPPVLQENEVAIFMDGAWKIAPDFRGKEVYDQATGELVEIKEIGALPVNVALTLPDHIAVKNAILSQIYAIESSITSRRMREAMLGTDKGWLAAADEKIAELRKTLQ